MAEKQMYPARLYDANGDHVADIEHEEDLLAAAARGGIVHAGGKSYVWDQRSAQWREAAATYEIKKADVEKPAATAAEIK